VTNSVRVFAPAKINLFLHVGDKRADGYHALQSLVVFADVGDELTLHRSRTLSLAIEGPFAGPLSIEGDNLVLRTARLLAEKLELPLGADIVLTKNLPVASGIGGGSADAGAAMRGLTRLWRRFLDPQKQLHIEQGAGRWATELGSDVPVCLRSSPSWMEGRGELITAAGIVPQFPLLLVNPGVAVSTGPIFQALKERRGTRMEKPEALHDKKTLLEFLAATINDLETPAREIQPVIGDVLDTLAAQPGALLTRMSGSGATCFALFESEDASTAAAEVIASRQRGWWVRAGRVAHDAVGIPQ